MPLFLLTLTKTIEASVEAESAKALREAAEMLSDADLHDWGDDGWQVEVDPLSRALTAKVKKADCGLTNGQILAWDDYQQALAVIKAKKEE